MNLFYKIRKNARIFAFLYFQMRLHTTYVSYIRFISAYQHFKCIREYDPHFWLSVSCMLHSLKEREVDFV